MVLEFDIRGNLKPYELIPFSLADFEENFVSIFDKTSSRHAIFTTYCQYTEDLRSTIKVPFFQWINGSFTTKKFNPKDLDVLTFIDFEVYKEKEKLIDERFSKWSVGKFYPKIDGYTVWSYPEGHKNFLTFHADQLYWQGWFGNTAFNRAKKRFRKGFIQINFEG